MHDYNRASLNEPRGTTLGEYFHLIATALFLSYLDKATEISQSAGGGSTPKGGWGKKPDEDDMAFRQGCSLMGMHMLKSGKKRNVKR